MKRGVVDDDDAIDGKFEFEKKGWLWGKCFWEVGWIYVGRWLLITVTI